MIQILPLWDSEDPEDVKLVDRLRKGFDKMGSWSVELPPKDSIYKLMLVLEKGNMESK